MNRVALRTLTLVSDKFGKFRTCYNLEKTAAFTELGTIFEGIADAVW